MYQKCPICQGSGKGLPLLGDKSEPICPTCHGERIIDEITGIPPSKNQPIRVCEHYFVKRTGTTDSSEYCVKCGRLKFY
jgi:DnaJ-class molecular chaperone